MTVRERAEQFVQETDGRWRLCPCGHHSCGYLQPTRFGTFYQGTGFTLDEAKLFEEVLHELHDRDI